MDLWTEYQLLGIIKGKLGVLKVLFETNLW